jgi:hypothetical protein
VNAAKGRDFFDGEYSDQGHGFSEEALARSRDETVAFVKRAI